MRVNIGRLKLTTRIHEMHRLVHNVSGGLWADGERQWSEGSKKMGYVLNALANLPVDQNVNFYIFIINGQYRDDLYRVLEENFFNIARDIGSHAVVAVGTDRRQFTTSVARHYLGKGHSDSTFTEMLPALLITDAHPEQLRTDSMRLVVPLRGAEGRFGGWHNFFTLLSQFARGESAEFLRRFETKEDLLDAVNKVIMLKPGIFGLGLNLNEVIERWNIGRKRRVAGANEKRARSRDQA